ncbi:MAG: ATP-binding protein [Betaproteobacteria bacterium]
MDESGIGNGADGRGLRGPGRLSERLSGRLRWWLPALIFVLLLAAALSLLSLSTTHESSQAQEQLITDTLWVKQTIQFQLDRSAETLQVLAHDIESRSLDAAAVRGRLEWFVRNTKEAVRVVYLDSAHVPILSIGREGNELSTAMPRPSAAELDTMVVAIDQARGRGKPIYGSPYVSDAGAMLAVHIATPAGQKAAAPGSVICVYAMSRILDENVPWWFAQDHEIVLSDLEEKVRGVRAVSGPGRGVYTHQTVLELDGTSLVLKSNSIRGAPSWILGALRGGIAVLTAMLLLSLFALWRDVKRRVHAEDMLREEAAFRKAMGDSVVTGLRARDMTGRVTYVNPAFCKMVDYAADELVGKLPPMAYWAPEYAHEYEERMAQIRAGNVTATAFETVFQRRSGQRFPVMIYDAPLLDSQGGQTGWMSSIVDVSEQKQAEEHMRMQQERLQDITRLTTMGEIASSLAHELNQPLAAITSYLTGSVNMLRNGAAPLAEIERTLEKANQQANRAGQVIRRVHDYVRKQEPQRVAVAMRELLQDCLPLIELQARNTGVRVTTASADDLPTVMADPVLLQQVLLNLTRNGIEAMAEADREHKRLEISLRNEGADMLRIDVRDYGTGVLAEAHEKLFSPFFTTKTEGMGMGLSICRSIVEVHGGRLWFESFARGTAFCVSLPGCSNDTHRR